MKTINRYSLIALMIALMAIVTGCTKNDGDPFGLYGVWHLTAAEDGTGAAIAIDPRTYIAFQNDIVKFYSNDGLVGTSESYGKLAQEGDHYLLTYTAARQRRQLQDRKVGNRARRALAEDYRARRRPRHRAPLRKSVATYAQRVVTA